MTRPDLILLHAPSNLHFREEPVIYGPISDVIPSTPIFEMYPIGFVSIAAYLEKRGTGTRIINIANRMLRDARFNVDRFVSKLSAEAFGIDLHWLPHASGSLELAEILKRHHPDTPVIFGGLSSSYFYKELMNYPQVDFVVRGDSTEHPISLLMQRIKSRSSVEDVPNLSWRDEKGEVHHNPLTAVPQDLDDLPLDYSYPVKSVFKYRSLANLLPFNNWLEYPITMALTCRGCVHECITCGGSKSAYKALCGRDTPAYRHPQQVARDVHSIQRYLNAPVFIIGDARQRGDEYAEELLAALNRNKIRVPIVLEFFAPPSPDFFRRVSQAIPNYNVQMSCESHDEEVRQAFGKGYRNIDLERAIQGALENGCRRFDLFYMVGLAKQDYSSVMATADYCKALVRDMGKGRLHPHISPLAPFIDPGSKVFENPEKYGYRLRWRTLEEHRQALRQPSWKDMLSYETQWMSREEIVDSTYEVALAFNQFKRESGLVSPKAAAELESRAREAWMMVSSKSLAGTVERSSPALARRAKDIKASTICQKRELEWQATPFLLSAPRILRALCRRGSS